MGRSWISDRESIQGHIALVHPVPMDSQDHFRMIRSHNDTIPTEKGRELMEKCVSD